MPLVKRMITVENDSTTYSKDLVDHIHYEPPNKVLDTDEIVEPSSDAQLAELAAMYPKEYAQKAKDLGIEPAAEGRLLQLLQLNAKELARKIGEMTQDVDEVILWELFEAETGDPDEELGTGKSRATVLDALKAKGIK